MLIIQRAHDIFCLNFYHCVSLTSLQFVSSLVATGSLVSLAEAPRGSIVLEVVEAVVGASIVASFFRGGSGRFI